MIRSLRGEVVVVTGASSGIGAATARELARRGAKVVLAARRTEELHEQARAIARTGGEAVAVPADVSDAEQVRRLVAAAREAFGRIDVLVNNAGAIWLKRLANSPVAGIEEIVNTNLLGAIVLTREVLPDMLARRHGAIVSVGSVAGRLAVEPLYSATKFGLRGFSLALRRQLAGSGVSVSLVSPGNIRTAMTDGVEKRLPGPELVARTVAQVIIEPRRELIVPREHQILVWIEQLLPDLADHLHRRRGWSRAS
jgi:NAD(P)-dependent dehydrogenase (short-subunit alcohol dehydrogenase family)